MAKEKKTKLEKDLKIIKDEIDENAFVTVHSNDKASIQTEHGIINYELQEAGNTIYILETKEKAKVTLHSFQKVMECLTAAVIMK
jgi:hypothetical protein